MSRPPEYERDKRNYILRSALIVGLLGLAAGFGIGTHTNPENTLPITLTLGAVGGLIGMIGAWSQYPIH